ncbi:MAG: SDR family oxidoreductase [Sandarakinorhabdus sp.]|nr:SDR family oxidoreductase [Sandarakinorhabdus sp.]
MTTLITGASTGIGRALADEFAAAGHDLIITARDGAALETVAIDLMSRHGVTVTCIARDLAAIGGGAALAHDIAALGLKVDVLVNNAGFGAAGAFAAGDAAPQLGMIDLNIRALVELTHIYWPGMIAAGRGGVLNVGSTGAFQPGPLMAIYYASKAFVLSFTEALWEEARGTGVKVSCLCPGPVVSEFRRRAGTDKTRLSQAGTPMPAAECARLAYAGWAAGRRVVVPGVRNRVLAALVPFMPRPLLLKTVRGLMAPI